MPRSETGTPLPGNPAWRKHDRTLSSVPEAPSRLQGCLVWLFAIPGALALGLIGGFTTALSEDWFARGIGGCMALMALLILWAMLSNQGRRRTAHIQIDADAGEVRLAFRTGVREREQQYRAALSDAERIYIGRYTITNYRGDSYANDLSQRVVYPVLLVLRDGSELELERDSDSKKSIAFAEALADLSGLGVGSHSSVGFARPEQEAPARDRGFGRTTGAGARPARAMERDQEGGASVVRMRPAVTGWSQRFGLTLVFLVFYTIPVFLLVFLADITGLFGNGDPGPVELTFAVFGGITGVFALTVITLGFMILRRRFELVLHADRLEARLRFAWPWKFLNQSLSIPADQIRAVQINFVRGKLSSDGESFFLALGVEPAFRVPLRQQILFGAGAFRKNAQAPGPASDAALQRLPLWETWTLDERSSAISVYDLEAAAHELRRHYNLPGRD